MVQFESGTRILRVIHGRDARATSRNRAAEQREALDDSSTVFAILVHNRGG